MVVCVRLRMLMRMCAWVVLHTACFVQQRSSVVRVCPRMMHACMPSRTCAVRMQAGEGRVDEAKQAYRVLLKIDPNNAMARAELEKL